MRISPEILKQYRQTYQEVCPQSSPNDFGSTFGDYMRAGKGFEDIVSQLLNNLLDFSKPKQTEFVIDGIGQEHFSSWLQDKNCPQPPPNGALRNFQVQAFKEVLREFFSSRAQRVVVNAVFTGTTRFITRGWSSVVVGTLGGIFLGGLGEGLRQFCEHGEVISGQMIAEKMVTGAIEGFAVGLGVGIASKVFSRFPRSNQLKQVTIPVAKQLASGDRIAA